MFAIDTVELDNNYLLRKDDLKEFDKFQLPVKDNISILPQWDCYTMGYAPGGRERFVSPDMQHHVYGKLGATGGNAFGTVLINGEAFGTWTHRFTGTKMNIDLKMFDRASNKLSEKIDNQFKKIALVLNAKSIDLKKDIV